MTSPSSTGSGPTSESLMTARLAGHEVADAQREHARALFFGDRRAMTGRDRVVVLLARRAALVDDAFDDASARPPCGSD